MPVVARSVIADRRRRRAARRVLQQRKQHGSGTTTTTRRRPRPRRRPRRRPRPRPRRRAVDHDAPPTATTSTRRPCRSCSFTGPPSPVAVQRADQIELQWTASGATTVDLRDRRRPRVRDLPRRRAGSAGAPRVRRQAAHVHARRTGANGRPRRSAHASTSASSTRSSSPACFDAPSSRRAAFFAAFIARFFSRISRTRSKVSTSAIDGQSAADGLPTRRAHAEPLAEQADEDPRLVLAEAGQRQHAREQLVAGRRVRPHVLGPAVVVLDEVRGTARASAWPSSPGSGAARACRGRSPRARPGPSPRSPSRRGARRRGAASSSERRAERPLHRDLLVEQHAEHHRERLRREQPVGVGDRA